MARRRGPWCRNTVGKFLPGLGRAMERLEGKRALPSVMFILEFPSLEQAKAWYNDPEYAHMIHLRQTGDRLRLPDIQQT